MKTIQEKTISHEQVIKTSLLVDVSDVVINILVAALSGSVTMISQALQGATDMLSSIFLYIGANTSRKKADSIHPFGYGREIYFWSFLAGLAMFGITATTSIYWGLLRLIKPEPIKNIPLALAVLFISLLTNGYAFLLSRKRLLKDKHQANLIEIFFTSPLIATKTTLLLDFMGSLAAVFGIIALMIFEITGDSRFDGVGAMAVGISLAFFSFFILRDIKNMLIGKSVPEQKLKEIKDIIKKFPEVNDVVELKVVYIGIKKLFILAEVNLNNKLKTDDIENLNDQIAAKIKKRIPDAFYIHIEPETRKNE